MNKNKNKNKKKYNDDKTIKVYSKIKFINKQQIININTYTQDNNISNNNNNKNEQNILINNSKIINYNDYELNNLSYKEALKIDKRSYLQYYFSLLKIKHILIFTFYTSSDYNSKIIKIILFLFSFALYFTMNTLFFNDATMHKIYEDQGSFNFIYQIPQILYSTIISSLINILIKYLSLSEKNILEIKNEKNNILEKANKVLKCLINKFLIFFVLIYLFLILFWYYLSCFCAVYQNTQNHLIKDTLISYASSLIYPFILNLLPGLFRIPSIANRKKEYLYIISKIIQLL